MLTTEQIARVAPSVFTEAPRGDRSDKYTYISTGRIIDEMREAGYGVTKAEQSRGRGSNISFAKHMVRFRAFDEKPGVGDTLPEIVLSNSHDGSSSYRLMAGLFRLVCSNGLVIAESTIVESRIRHSGNILGDVMDAVVTIRAALPKLGDRVARFKAVTLTQSAVVEFADKALTLKYGEEKPYGVSAMKALRTRRYEDRIDPSLWTVFNVLQENLISGTRGIRAVRSVDGQTDLNRGLWSLAESYALGA